MCQCPARKLLYGGTEPEAWAPGCRTHQKRGRPGPLEGGQLQAERRGLLGSATASSGLVPLADAPPRTACSQLPRRPRSIRVTRGSAVVQRSCFSESSQEGGFIGCRMCSGPWDETERACECVVINVPLTLQQHGPTYTWVFSVNSCAVWGPCLGVRRRRRLAVCLVLGPCGRGLSLCSPGSPWGSWSPSSADTGTTAVGFWGSQKLYLDLRLHVGWHP